MQLDHASWLGHAEYNTLVRERKRIMVKENDFELFSPETLVVA